MTNTRMFARLVLCSFFRGNGWMEEKGHNQVENESIRRRTCRKKRRKGGGGGGGGVGGY